MKVKTSSWHYRLWKLGRQDHTQPKDLCRYFWHIMLLKILGPLVLVVGFLIGVGALIWVIAGHPAETAFYVVGALIGVGLVVGVVKLGEKLYNRHSERSIQRKMSLAPPKEPGLFRQMLKARKRAVCPLIEVIDE